MTRIRVVSGCVVALAWGLACPGLSAAPLIPLEQFAAPPAMSSPSISPDGKHLVYIGMVQGAPMIMVHDFSAQAPRPLMQGTAKMYSVRWCAFKNDERVLCSFQGVEYQWGRPFGSTRLVAANIDGSQMKVLRQNRDYRDAQMQDQILSWLPEDPKSVVIQLDADGDNYTEAYQLDIYSGLKRLVQSQRQPVLSWMTDRSGLVRFGFGFKSGQKTGVYVARRSEQAPWRVIDTFDRYDKDEFHPLGFGPRPNTLFVDAPKDGRGAVWEYDLEGTGDLQLVYANAEVDVDRAISWPSDGHLIGFRYETDLPHAYYIDDLARRIDLTMQKALPGRFAYINGSSKDSKRLLLAAYSDVKPMAYYLLDLGTGAFQQLMSSNVDLENAALAPTKPVTIVAGDLKIPGYLTLPAGKDPHNLPTVIYPHGGPYARDTWGFDPLLQMMVSRGYAVLQVNFRGSTGYGRQWLDAGWRGWGTVIHDDITAGAHWLVAQGVADPKRMCIVGWSHGGYAALIGVVKEPALYRCAASIAGVSDLNDLSSQERFFYGGTVAAQESIGVNKRELKEVSPLQHADQVKVPVLLVHGEADYTVLSSHSKAMAKELRDKKVPTDLVLIEGGEHELDGPGMRLTLLQKLEAFLGANLGTP